MKAEYIAHSGSDLTVVNAARVSFDKEADWIWECPHCEGDRDKCWLHDDKCGYDGKAIVGRNALSSRDAKLIHYLAAHNHFTPFTHCTITLRETVPIFVARQRFKHTVGFSYNEVSRRYVDEEPKFFVPGAWRKRAENKKQGSLEEAVATAMDCTQAYQYLTDFCLSTYQEMLDRGVAPEQARMVLPQSMYTSYYCTGSLAAFARAYRLRSTPDAQAEIQDLASQWDKIIAPLYPVSWKALTTND